MGDKHLASIEVHGGFLTITSLRCLQQIPAQSTRFDQRPRCWQYREDDGPNLDPRLLEAGECMPVQWWNAGGWEWNDGEFALVTTPAGNLYVGWHFDESGLVLTPEVPDGI